MTDTAKALYSFFSGFGIPAYARYNVPDDAVTPYITYDLIEPEPLALSMLHAWVWYRGSSYGAVLAKCDQIKAAIGTGVSIPTDSGFIVIFRDNDTPFMQQQPDPNPDIKCAYLTMILHANTD